MTLSHVCLERKKNSTTIGDVLGKVYINTKLIILKKYLKNYDNRTTCLQYYRAAERFHLTLSSDSGLQKFSSSVNPRDTKCLSVRYQLINDNLDI